MDCRTQLQQALEGVLQRRTAGRGVARQGALGGLAEQAIMFEQSQQLPLALIPGMRPERRRQTSSMASRTKG